MPERAVAEENVITDVESGERIIDMLNGRVPMSRVKKQHLKPPQFLKKRNTLPTFQMLMVQRYYKMLEILLKNQT